MGGACGMYGKVQVNTGFWWEQKDRLEYLGEEAKIILK
jgi:hypothetical protein